MKDISRRKLLKWGALGATTVFAYVTGRAVFHLSEVGKTDTTSLTPLPEGFVDDASRLNKTKVKSILSLSGDSQDVEKQIAQTISEANRLNTPIALAGSRHTMGGHTIYPEGTILDTAAFNKMHLDARNELLHVQAGATWSEIIPYLDSKGYSVAVMQSNNDFSVGGTISANAHGWQTGRPPIGSTVESFRLVKADGSVLTCSRNENKDLFSLVIGGYGLFGIITDVVLRIVKNESYTSERHVLDTKDYASFFLKNVHDNPNIGMAFGRLSVEDNLLDEALLYTFVRASDAPQPLHLMKPENEQIAKMKRLIFRGSAGSAYGKALRWDAEKVLSEQVGKALFSRNELLNESARNILNFSESSTDILHEYFIPFENFYAFTKALSKTVRRHRADLLNVTVRDVKKDEDAFMRYAHDDRLALVLLFTQERTDEGEKKMQTMTLELIDEALALGGTYYLPYRLHATDQQIKRSYPMVENFFALKKKHDPNELFQNQFYLSYS